MTRTGPATGRVGHQAWRAVAFLAMLVLPGPAIL